MIIDSPHMTASTATDRSFDRLFSPPLSQCPACGSRELEPVVEAVTDEVHFFCGRCERCWHVELGFAHPVAPSSCMGVGDDAERLIGVATEPSINK